MANVRAFIRLFKFVYSYQSLAFWPRNANVREFIHLFKSVLSYQSSSFRPRKANVCAFIVCSSLSSAINLHHSGPETLMFVHSFICSSLSRAINLHHSGPERLMSLHSFVCSSLSSGKEVQRFYLVLLVSGALLRLKFEAKCLSVWNFLTRWQVDSLQEQTVMWKKSLLEYKSKQSLTCWCRELSCICQQYTSRSFSGVALNFKKHFRVLRFYKIMCFQKKYEPDQKWTNQTRKSWFGWKASEEAVSSSQTIRVKKA